MVSSSLLKGVLLCDNAYCGTLPVPKLWFSKTIDNCSGPGQSVFRAMRFTLTSFGVANNSRWHQQATHLFSFEFCRLVTLKIAYINTRFLRAVECHGTTDSGVVSIRGSNKRVIQLTSIDRLTCRFKPGHFLHPAENGAVRLLMLENIDDQAVSTLDILGFHVDQYTTAINENELVKMIPSYHAIGIRSKTRITSRAIKAAPEVCKVQCLYDDHHQSLCRSNCWNSCSTRLSQTHVLSQNFLWELVVLSRQLFQRSCELHNGFWNKRSEECWALRGKTLGIIVISVLNCLRLLNVSASE